MSTKAQVLRDPQSCLNKAGSQEPVFVLRARDPLAAQTIRLWAQMAADGTHAPEKIDQALHVAAEFEKWHEENVPSETATVASARQRFYNPQETTRGVYRPLAGPADC